MDDARKAIFVDADTKLKSEIGERRHAEAINRTLFAISNAVNTTYNLKELYRSIHRSLADIIDVTNFYIGLVDREEKTLYFPFYQDEQDSDFYPIHDFDEYNSLTGEVVVRRCPVLLLKKELLERVAQNRVRGPIPMVWLGVPLIVRDVVIGVIAVQSYTDPDRYGDTDIEVLLSVSDQVAIAIDRKRAEDRLRKSEARFRNLFEQSNDAVIIHRKERIIDVNRRACEMLGYQKIVMLGMAVADLYEDEYRKTEEVRSGKPLCFETKWKKADGSWLDVEVSSSVVDEKTDVIQGIGRDITLRKRAEEEKIKVRKLESIGLLSGGIAHDFNNLLSVVTGYLSLARDEIAPENRVRHFIKQAEEACVRSKTLTKRLLTFSEGGNPVKTLGAIDQLIFTRVAGFETGDTIRITADPPKELFPVEFDADQIGRVLEDLMTNAVEAMPSGGVIRITAANCDPDDVPPEIGDRKSRNGYVRITVNDTGTGISEENRSKIFDPYFSTKQRGADKGMGLGLAIVYSIVSKHDGHIEIRSEVGKGTDVNVYLPAAPKRDRAKPVNRPGSVPVAKRQKSVLIMDDEPMIIELALEILRRLGYRSAFASHGDEAIELYERAMSDRNPFDAIILDLSVKQGLGGRKTLKAISALDPNVRAIVTSGYSDDPVMTDYRAHGFVAALEKPYTKSDMNAVLTKVFG